MENIYDRSFYEWQSSGSYLSAKTVVPLVLDITPVKSVCDVGCGVGTWLRAFSDYGVDVISGFDGAYVNTDQLQIPMKSFQAKDLNLPFSVDNRFDLVISLEVAEHLARDRADSFIANLVALSDVVLFSAAVPGQGGTDHINEQWQSYWAALFLRHDYIPCDLIRPKIWNDPQVEWWYRQNILLYIKKNSVKSLLGEFPADCVLDLVHPEMWKTRAKELEELGLVNVLRAMRKMVGSAISRKINS